MLLKPGPSVVRVEGDSAYPVIFPGQDALVDQTRDARDGDLMVAVMQDGNCLLKRLLDSDKGPMLVSVNIGRDLIPLQQYSEVWPVVGVAFQLLRWGGINQVQGITNGSEA